MPDFETSWPQMRFVVQKLLRQQNVTQQEWHDLFSEVHLVCVWDEKAPLKLFLRLSEDIHEFIVDTRKTIMVDHMNDDALLKSYVRAWRQFLNLSTYVPMPFTQLNHCRECRQRVLRCGLPPQAAQSQQSTSKTPLANGGGGLSNSNQELSVVKCLMLESWYKIIFADIHLRLLSSAMKFILTERLGAQSDPQLVIGVRESYVYLSRTPSTAVVTVPIATGQSTQTQSIRADMYGQYFENSYIESARSFYHTKALECALNHGICAYMKWVDEVLHIEYVRAERYLALDLSTSASKTSTKQHPLLECLNLVLIDDFKDQMLTECPQLMAQNCTDLLALMFRLMSRIQDGPELMLKHLHDYVKQRGLADMARAAETILQDSERYVELLLELFRKFSHIVKHAFQDDARATTVRDQAFKSVVNDTQIFHLQKAQGLSSRANASPESKCPELLANYCDMLLRKTALSRRLSSDEISTKLKDVLLVLKYVQNKDVFMRYHKAHLTRRLILDVSADSDKEEFMLNCLRELGMPAEHINKLARMFQDMKVSDDLQSQFRRFISKKLDIKIEPSGDIYPNNNDLKSVILNSPTVVGQQSSTLTQEHSNYLQVIDALQMKILNSGAWSRVGGLSNNSGATSGNSVNSTSGANPVVGADVKLPKLVEQILPEIEEFYKLKYSGRRLEWHHHMSNGTLTLCTTNGGKFDLDVTCYQMVCLMSWNDLDPGSWLTFDQLLDITKLAPGELRRTLWSLVANPKLKFQILLCDPSSASGRSNLNTTETSSSGLQATHFDGQCKLSVNQSFCLVKQGKCQQKGRVNLIGVFASRFWQNESGATGASASSPAMSLKPATVQKSADIDSPAIARNSRDGIIAQSPDSANFQRVGISGNPSTLVSLATEQVQNRESSTAPTDQSSLISRFLNR